MGRNLLTYPYTATSDTVNGITFTINEDGSIILNGTSTAAVNIFFRPINAFMLPAGKYRMSNGNPDAKGYMLIGAEQSEWTGQITGNTEFEKTVYGTVGYCLYQIPKGNTFSNVTIYPSLECIMTTAEMLVEVAKGTQKVYEDGKKAQYDEFWDAFQQNGERDNYNYGLAGAGWTNETFKPKYDIVPLSCARMMAHTQIKGSLKEILEECGVVLDSSKANYFEYVFDSSPYITEVPHFVGNYSFSGLFTYCSALTTVSLEPKEKTTFNNTFLNCISLENLTITGTIGNDVDLHWSTKLSKASITSVINALSTSTSGKTLTLSKAAVNKAFETSTGAGDGEASAAWISLEQSRSNWTIALV